MIDAREMNDAPSARMTVARSRLHLTRDRFDARARQSKVRLMSHVVNTSRYHEVKQRGRMIHDEREARSVW